MASSILRLRRARARDRHRGPSAQAKASSILRRGGARDSRRLGLAWIAAFALIAAAACSANSGGGRETPGGGTGAAGGTAGSGIGVGGTGATTAAGGTAGTLTLDAGSMGGAVNADAACESVTQAAETIREPADIVWAIDTSCSMSEETFAVQQNINAFSQQIAASGIDVRVVMLAEASIFVGFQGICVAPPLGSGQCPVDTNLPHYWHHPTADVGSNDGLKVLHDTFNDWKFMLRPEASKTIVVVTDDDAREPGFDDARKFIDDFTALDPILQDADGNPAWKMSGIYSFTQCQNAAQVSAVWDDLVTTAGGVKGDICNCPPGNAASCGQTFQQVFDDLASAIVTGSKPLDCEWGIPEPPEGQKLDPSRVNVHFGKDGMADTIYNVDSGADCDETLGGWYYDDPTTPSRVIACPSTCDEVTSIENGIVELLFGCQTEQIPK